MLGSSQLIDTSKAEMEASRKRVLTSPATAKTKDTFTTPPNKKLKQARLPFQPLSSPAQNSSPVDRPAKKRRISDISPQQTVIKPKEVKDTTPSSSAKKSANKRAEKRKVLKPLALEPPVVETEVTSSSEEPLPKSPVLKKKPKPLEKFLQSVQQPTSTSDEEIESKEVKDAAGGDDETGSKEVRSSSAEVITVDDSSVDGIKDTASTTSDVQIAEIHSADEDDEEEEEEDEDEISTLDSSIGSEETAGDTSIESVESVTNEDAATQPKDPVDSSQVSSTPKNAIKPPRKTPKSAKSLKREQEREKLKEEKAKLKAEKMQKAEEEKAEKQRLKEEAKAAKEEAKAAKEEAKAAKEEARAAKEAEIKAAKAEKEAKAAEAKRLKELEREQKLKEKQEKLEREEKEREEKKAQKEEKQRQKILEQEAKAEEKRRKEEERLKKIEEEKNQKNQVTVKQQAMFKSFFKKIETPEVVKEPKEKICGRYAPFQLQKGMALAPVYGFDKLSKKEDRHKFDESVTCQDATNLYLNQLKCREIIPGKRSKTVIKRAEPVAESMETDDDSIQMVEDLTPASTKTETSKTKVKLLQFHENHRPAYYGTWSKISQKITPRNYLQKDEDFLDYDFDSDEEWEEPGESLSDSEGEEDSEAGSGGEESDDGFFVEHGYLSESEDPLDDDETVEQWRARRANKALAWEVELKRQTQVLKPVIVGPFWVNGSDNQCNGTKLQAYKAVILTPTTVPIATTFSIKPKDCQSEERSTTPTTSSGGQSKSGPVNKKPVPEEAMPHLIRLVHGNTVGVKGLIREFREYWRLEHRSATPVSSSTSSSSANPSSIPPDTADLARSVSPLPGSQSISSTTPVRSPPVAAERTGTTPTPGEVSSTNSTPDEPEIEHAISKRQLDLMITSIAVREKRKECYARICWYVHKPILEKYNMQDLPVPCQWQHRTGYLAANRAASPQVTTGQNATVLPPQKISSAPATAARRIVPTKVGPSVMTLLQQQKPAVKPKPCVPTTGAAGMLATAAAMCSAQQQLSTTQLATSNPGVASITHNAAVPEAASADPPKPAKKKVLTLNKFFVQPNKSKSPNTVQGKSEPVKASTIVCQSDSPSINKKQEIIVNNEPPPVANSSLAKTQKPEIMIIRDLLSEARVNRLKSSPERKKEAVQIADTTTTSSPEIITLD